MKRTKQFAKNMDLVSYLNSLNKDLLPVERELLKRVDNKLPIIFIVGPIRSGTTMLLQWLANTKQISYPSNFMSRFYEAPILGARIQKLISDDRYNFRNELSDLGKNVEYNSENGKTKGFLAPNEFWYFWRSVFDNEDEYYIKNDTINDKDIRFKNELLGIAQEFEMPFALKAVMFNYRIPFLSKLFKNSIFIYIKRNPIDNINSVIKTRKKQYGNINDWYGFKIPEYQKLKTMNAYDQVANQIYYLNKATQNGLNEVSLDKKIILRHDDFCNHPEKLYEELKLKLSNYSVYLEPVYNGISKFEISKVKEEKKEITDAYMKLEKKFLQLGFDV